MGVFINLLTLKYRKRQASNKLDPQKPVFRQVLKRAIFKLEKQGIMASLLVFQSHQTI